MIITQPPATNVMPVHHIGEIPIGSEYPPAIIAEIGINHGGNLNEAKLLASLAADAGADIIKSQLHIPEAEMSDNAKNIVPSHCDDSIYDVISDTCLSVEDEYELMLHVKTLGAQYLCTPFSPLAADILLRDFKVDAVKIGSGEFTNPLVLEPILKSNMTVIASTGMTKLSEVQEVLGLFREHNNNPILLHTTNIYPTPPDLVRLGGISELQGLVGADSVGLSDHTTSNLACLGAAALGAVLLERHFTDSKERIGPDIANSMTPAECRTLKESTHILHKMIGGTKADFIPEEQNTRDFARATLVTTIDLKPGDILTSDCLTAKRPGNVGIPALRIHEVLGKTITSPLIAGSHLLKYHFTS